jgi:hypothetical protein
VVALDLIVSLDAQTYRREDNAMANKGFSHIGLSTLDLDKTVEFYQDVLASG